MVRYTPLIASLTLALATVADAGPEDGAGPEIYLGKPDYIERSETALLSGNHAEAEEILLRALDSGVGDKYRYKVHNNLCVAQFLQDKFEKALEHCKAAVEAESNRWKAYNNLGNVLTELGRYDEAIAAYETGLDLVSDSSKLKNNLARAKRRRERRKNRAGS